MWLLAGGRGVQAAWSRRRGRRRAVPARHLLLLLLLLGCRQRLRGVNGANCQRLWRLVVWVGLFARGQGMHTAWARPAS